MLAENADTNEPLRNWDYLFLGYDTARIDTYIDIANKISDHWERASQGQRPYPRPYQRFALFGHSLGTLGIRQLLCAWSLQPAAFMPQLHSATLFGVPITGSILAYLSRLKVADALEPLNPQLRMLREWTRSAYASKPWPKVKVVVGDRDWVVGSKKAAWIDWDGDGRRSTEALDHRALVKPDSWDDSPIVGFVESALK
jgi:hypothetical protein